MLRATLAVSLMSLALPFGFERIQDDAHSADRKAIERAAQDYVEGFYLAKPELIERGVHPELDKFGYWYNGDAKSWQGPSLMNHEQALKLAAGWNKDGKQGELRPFEIEVLDHMDKMASVKLTAEWGVDYMQIAKFDDVWQVRQVMWQSHSPGGK